jgi:hypothetical protein
MQLQPQYGCVIAQRLHDHNDSSFIMFEVHMDGRAFTCYLLCVVHKDGCFGCKGRKEPSPTRVPVSMRI